MEKLLGFQYQRVIIGLERLKTSVLLHRFRSSVRVQRFSSETTTLSNKREYVNQIEFKDQNGDKSAIGYELDVDGLKVSYQ